MTTGDGRARRAVATNTQRNRAHLLIDPSLEKETDPCPNRTT
jgi:hypothetical protein